MKDQSELFDDFQTFCSEIKNQFRKTFMFCAMIMPKKKKNSAYFAYVKSFFEFS